MRKGIAAAVAVVGLSILGTVAVANVPDKPSRDDAQKAIRTSAYELMKAFLTQDVKTFKRHSARRTLKLIDLTYQAAREDPRYQRELQNAQITNVDEFLSYFMLGMATQYLQTVPLSPEAAARRVANDSTVSFISDSAATIIVSNSGFASAKLVGREWRIDLTDWLKKAILKEIKSPELRAKIKSL